MQAGKLKHKIDIQERIMESDGAGGQTETYSSKYEIWANVEPLKGNRLYLAQQRDMNIDTLISIRYKLGIKPDWRIKFENTMYKIISIIDVKSENKKTEIMCQALQSEMTSGAVVKTEITYPEDEAIDVNKLGTATTAAFTLSPVDADDTHAATHWQVAHIEDADFNTAFIDVISKKDLESLTFTEGQLRGGSEYKIRARHIGAVIGNGPWSDIVTFTPAV